MFSKCLTLVKRDASIPLFRLNTSMFFVLANTNTKMSNLLNITQRCQGTFSVCVHKLRLKYNGILGLLFKNNKFIKKKIADRGSNIPRGKNTLEFQRLNMKEWSAKRFSTTFSRIHCSQEAHDCGLR